MDCSTPGLPVHHHLPELTQTHVHHVSDAIQPFHPFLSPSPAAFNYSQHQGLFNESVLHIRWPKYWSFSFSISPFNEYSGLISFRIDWFDLLAVQGTLKSLLQHHNSKASIIQGSAQCPQPCSRGPLTHVFARDSWTLLGKSGSVSCGVTALFSWVLVLTGSVCALQESVSQSCVSSGGSMVELKATSS